MLTPPFKPKKKTIANYHTKIRVLENPKKDNSGSYYH